MNAKNIFEDSNAYNAKVTLDLMEHIEQQRPKEERIAVLLSHIVNAHQIWNERILGVPNSVQVFEVRNYEDLKSQIQKNQEDTTMILQSRELEETIQYKNTKGQTYINSIFQIFQHVFNHGTYHRGQINQLIAREGKQPMVTDYIFYNRTEVIG